MPQQEAGWRSDKLLSDQKVYITRRILMVTRISPMRCSKSHIALFLSNTHLRWFYLLRHTFCPLCWVNTIVLISSISLLFRYTMTLFLISCRHPSIVFYLSVSSVVAQFIALNHTYAHKPVLILVICFTYLLSISHTVLFHIICVYSLPE